MLDFDAKKFKNAANRVIRAGGTLRDGVQELIEMGLSHYRDTNDTEYLSRALRIADNTQCISGNRVKQYIRELANVRWLPESVKEDGTVVEGRFKMDKRDSSDAQVSEPTMPWWEFNKEPIAKDLDFLASVTKLVTRGEKAQADGKLKDGQNVALTVIKQALEHMQAQA